MLIFDVVSFIVSKNYRTERKEDLIIKAIKACDYNELDIEGLRKNTGIKIDELLDITENMNRKGLIYIKNKSYYNNWRNKIYGIMVF